MTDCATARRIARGSWRITLEVARQMARELPICRARWVEREGHFLHYNHWPEILADLIRIEP